MCLAAKLAVRADLTRYARYLGGEYTELLNHGIDDVGGAQELAFQRPSVHVQAHGLGQIPLGNGRDGVGHTFGWTKQIFNQRVDRNFHLAPRSPGFVKAGALACSAFFSHNLPNALQFPGHLLVGRNNGIESVCNFPRQSRP